MSDVSGWLVVSCEFSVAGVLGAGGAAKSGWGRVGGGGLLPGWQEGVGWGTLAGRQCYGGQDACVT